ncbi:MAG: hypothetical protein FJ297_13025 [Planctomycetes bacterium]|nr:hypothetical protein [Planctomycetota bacterium]
MTNHSLSNDILNRVLILHYRSLPSYLADAHPWMRESARDSAARQALSAVILDQRKLADEIAAVLVDRREAIAYGGFPMRFTGYNDLAIEFLIGRVVDECESNIRTLESFREPLRRDDIALSLVERAIGAAKAHVEMLTERAAAPSGVA